MSATIRETSWKDIQALHATLDAACLDATSIAEAAQRFATGMAAAFESVALARLFLVVQARRLPAAERAWATTFATTAGRTLDDATPVLVLAGTAGREDAWRSRERSAGHRAIPLVDKELVEGAPMIAELLASLRVELVGLSADAPAQLRSMSGGLNARFYVPDARTTVDGKGRHVIASREFVAKHAIVTVFGMGGTYVGGELAVAIVFTREPLDAHEVDRFPSFISSFKMATSKLMAAGKLF